MSCILRYLYLAGIGSITLGVPRFSMLLVPLFFERRLDYAGGSMSCIPRELNLVGVGSVALVHACLIYPNLQ